jgi:phage tail-like protein
LVEDYVPPTVEQILTWDRRTLRVKFSERMTTTGSGPESIYFYRDVSGRVRYYRRYNVGTEVSPSWKYNVIEAPTANFSDGEVGCFLGSARAQNSVNNGAMTILERLSGSLVVVDGSLTDEGPADLTVETPPALVLTSYRVVPKAVAAGVIQPVFSPIVVEASEVDPLTLAEGESTEEYVWLNFQDDLTPEVDYQLEVTKVEDSDGVPVGCLYDFTSWQPANVPNRRWDLFDMLPQMNRDADVSKDLERFIRCIDEVAHILLSDVDHFGHIYDPFYTKEEVLDILLAHLGNTLLFVGGLTAQKKRDLIPLLVPMYKQRGTAKGIEDAVSFFLSKTIIVAPWDAPADTWTLGVSLLGHNTYLGPSRSFVRYSFYVEHIDALTSAEESIIREIVEFVRPAHTHFVGFRQV